VYCDNKLAMTEAAYMQCVIQDSLTHQIYQHNLTDRSYNLYTALLICHYFSHFVYGWHYHCWYSTGMICTVMMALELTEDVGLNIGRALGLPKVLQLRAKQMFDTV